MCDAAWYVRHVSGRPQSSVFMNETLREVKKTPCRKLRAKCGANLFVEVFPFTAHMDFGQW